MTFPRRRNRHPRFNGAAADHAATELLAAITPAPEDGATYELGEPPAAWDGTNEGIAAAWPGSPPFPGASDIGVMAIAITQAPPLDDYQPDPASFPALQAVPEPRDILPPVPITEAAVIGDELKLPVIWCEMGGCIGFFHDPGSKGFADTRRLADEAGWRTDARGLLACPDCQQTRADYDTPQPVAWHHPEVARRWHAREPLSDTGAFRLGVEAELGRRVSYENPALARAIAGATHRTAGALCRSSVSRSTWPNATSAARNGMATSSAHGPMLTARSAKPWQMTGPMTAKCGTARTARRYPQMRPTASARPATPAHARRTGAATDCAPAAARTSTGDSARSRG